MFLISEPFDHIYKSSYLHPIFSNLISDTIKDACKSNICVQSKASGKFGNCVIKKKINIYQ